MNSTKFRRCFGPRLLIAAILGGAPLIFLIGCSNQTGGNGTATAEAVHAVYATLDAANIAAIGASLSARSTSTAVATGETAFATVSANLPAPTSGASLPFQTPTTTPTEVIAPSPRVTTIATPSSVNAANTSPSFQSYMDPQGRFSFLLPVGWQFERNPQPGVAVQVFNGTILGNVNVAVEDAGQATLDQYVSSALAEIAAQYPQFRLVPPGVQSVDLGSHPGRRYELQGESDAGQVHVTQFVTLVGNMAYILTITAPESDYEAFARECQVFIASITIPAPTTTR